MTSNRYSGYIQMTSQCIHLNSINFGTVSEDSVTEDTRLREQKEKLQELNDSLSRKYKTDHINILLLGEIRSGKSSLYNTLATVLFGEVVNVALTGPEDSSVTTRLHRYELKTEKGKDMPIRVIDIRGFTKDRDYEHEIDKILDGNVKPGYEFGSKSKKIDKEKTLAGGPYKIHVVCFVVDVTQVPRQQHSKMVTQIRKMKEKIRSRDLPVIGVATKFDVLCPQIQENVANIEKSKKALNAVKRAAEYLEIQEKCVFPVVNYTEDTVIDKAKDMLILKVLDCIEGQARNYLEQDLDWQREPSVWTGRIDSLENENVVKNKKNLLSKMKDVEESVRILCVGRTNTGKSSFIDSVMSALSGEISCRATAGLTQSMNEERDGIPDTKRYNTYQLKVSENGNETQETNVYLCDMPGIHEKNGVQLNQIKCVIEGHVPSRYKVLSGINEESKGYVKEPGNKDKIHCVCLFFDGNDVSEREMKCIQELKSWLRDNEIPLIAVVTKIDLLSEELRAGRQNPYCVQRLTESIVNIEKKYGFKRKNVYPVRNYVHEDTVKGNMNALLLAAFKKILMLAIETKKQLDEDGTAVDP
ncbi:uncharacterized protein LOC128556629 [Mercenaria mercenaria]|uniref:uncharacterized protein LOC128556629 n=1 Tax=Mercenaria mercenaria TaxID=6596 RepID=UPI00234F26B0|nr:uncharacterized protein LOC128556629 [Mercenaria mercenaria]